jgi:hypothetical protein
MMEKRTEMEFPISLKHSLPPTAAHEILEKTTDGLDPEAVMRHSHILCSPVSSIWPVTEDALFDSLAIC